MLRLLLFWQTHLGSPQFGKYTHTHTFPCLYACNSNPILTFFLIPNSHWFFAFLLSNLASSNQRAKYQDLYYFLSLYACPVNIHLFFSILNYKHINIWVVSWQSTQCQSSTATCPYDASLSGMRTIQSRHHVSLHLCLTPWLEQLSLKHLLPWSVCHPFSWFSFLLCEQPLLGPHVLSSSFQPFK